MEITCSRCHQAIPADSLYCPTCGLPQLVYSSEEGEGPAQAERSENVVREAGWVEWRPALRAALVLAVPAGLLSCGMSPVGALALLWMAVGAAWAVMLYARRQKAVQQPFWLTAGAGVRIGLVTGILAGWMAFAATGISLFLTRFAFHQGKDFDDSWQSLVAQVSAQWQQMSAMRQDAQAAELLKSVAAWLLTPEGRAGSILGGLAMLEAGLLVFAMIGGAVGAKLVAGPRRTEAGN